jgi:DNA polymerase III subunit epsilon
MGFALVILVALVCIVGFFIWIATKSKRSQGEFDPQTTLGSQVDPTEEYRHRFHEKALREERSPVQHPQSEEPLTQDVKIPLDAGLSAWLPENFVVLDLETTGLSPSLNEIIEIGAIRVTLGTEMHTAFQTLVIPKKGIGADITRLTGITQRMVDRNGRPAALALGAFAEFVGDLPLVIFNAPFDMGFLWNTGKKHGIAICNRYACALQLSRRAWPQLSSHKLTFLARHFELPTDDTHRSLGDARRALYVFAKAALEIGERVRWDYSPLDWRVEVAYNKERDANRIFCAETRPLEATDLALALSRYAEAIERMYGYEAATDGRYADASILDRVTLCLWKLGRYNELVDAVDQFAGKFPDVQSSLMTAVLKRRERAMSKLPTAQSQCQSAFRGDSEARKRTIQD